MRASAPAHDHRFRHPCRVAFTLVEMLVVIAIIALLIGIIVPALSGGLKTANLAKSMSSLKQVATYMQSYSSENREYIVPSQFDYTAAAATYPVKVRSNPAPAVGLQYQGTWTDILWMYSGIKAPLAQYEYDSPDQAFYDSHPDYADNPFRSSGPNSRDYTPGNGIPVPFGAGAHEAGAPGYFAANDFFNSRPDAPPSPSTTPGGAPIPTPADGRWYVTGQIKSPDRSMYAVDSLAGETIAPVAGPWDNPAAGPGGGSAANLQADLRYNGACLMLFLDGHSETEGAWRNLTELEGQVTVGGVVTKGRNIRISQLTKSGLPWVP